MTNGGRYTVAIAFYEAMFLGISVALSAAYMRIAVLHSRRRVPGVPPRLGLAQCEALATMPAPRLSAGIFCKV